MSSVCLRVRARGCLLACAFQLLTLLGCGAPAWTPEELKTAALAARDEARSAQAEKDPEAAERAARRAEEALERLRTLASGGGALGAQAQAVLAASDAAAREARYLAELAAEEDRLAGKLNGLKAKAYRAARSTALAATFKGLSLAAEQAAKNAPNRLPGAIQEPANFAANLAGCKPLADGSPDWVGIAGCMDAASTRPQPEWVVTLAVGFLVCGQFELALLEASSLDPLNPPVLPRISAADRVPLTYMLRGLVFRANGFNHLAAREFIAALRAQGGAAPGAEAPPWLRARIHTLSALGRLYEKDLTGADREVAAALKADPQGPLSAFLTGERLAAGGEYERAAVSLESCGQVPGADEWLLKRMAARAREIRDGKGAAEPLFLDTAFLCQVGLHYACASTRNLEATKELSALTDSAKSFCWQVLKQLPGLGAGEGERPAAVPLPAN